MKLLLIDDSEALSQTLSRSFLAEGHACDVAGDGEGALQFLRSFDYDAVVLDLMLPRVDGFGVLASYRAAGGRAPVLVLSARGEVADRVRALDEGADDYLVKPFSLDELMARVRALSRRPAQPLATVLSWDALEVDTRRRGVRWHERAIALTPKEFALLELLLRNQGRVMSRAVIFERLYDVSSDASDKVVEVIVSTLRTKLELAGAKGIIQTRRGFGYVLG